MRAYTRVRLRQTFRFATSRCGCAVDPQRIVAGGDNTVFWRFIRVIIARFALFLLLDACTIKFYAKILPQLRK